MTADTSWRNQAGWQAVGFLAAAAALCYADRAAIAAVLPALRTNFALGDAQLGLLGSVFLWSYALASPVAGAVADRWPRHWIVALSLAGWSVVTVLTGAATGFAVLLGARVLLGLTESLYLPAATALLAEHHAPATRGRAMSLHSIGLNFGVVLGGTFAGYLADGWGWRAGFWVLGLSGVVLALLAPRMLPPAPARVESRTVARTVRPAVIDAWRYLLRVPSYHVLLAKAMLAGVAVWIFLNWLPLYFHETFGMSLGSAGLAGTFMLQVSTILGIFAGGWISDRAVTRDPRHRMLVQGGSYLAAAPFLLFFLNRPGVVLVTLAVSFFSFFRGLGQANENPVVCEVVPVRFRSTALGLMNMSATAAGGVGVLLAGVLKRSWGLGAIFAGLSGLFVLAGLALLAAHRWCMGGDLARSRAEDARW